VLAPFLTFIPLIQMHSQVCFDLQDVDARIQLKGRAYPKIGAHAEQLAWSAMSICAGLVVLGMFLVFTVIAGC